MRSPARFPRINVLTIDTKIIFPAGSVSVPSITFGDEDTGFYEISDDIIGVSVKGVECARFSTDGTYEQFIVPLQDRAAKPSYAFGDGDTGFYESADDVVHLSLAGVANVSWSGTGYFSTVAGSWELESVAASSTVPTFCPNKADLNTGVGSAAADQLSLIAGGVEGVRVEEDTTITTRFNGLNGSWLNIKTISEAVTINIGAGAAGVATAANLAPANSYILAVAATVTTAPGGGAITLDVGRTLGGNLDEFIDGMSCDIINETGDFYENHDAITTAPFINTIAGTFTLTTNINVIVSAMVVRVVVWYLDITPPTD